MGVLLIVFAIVIGYATFIENDYDAITARALIYNTRWFEILLGFMVLNFIGMIFTKHLYLKSKWNILIIHVALVIIIIGAGLTRYIGFEGQMHIRDGQTTNIYSTTDTFFSIHLKKGEREVEVNNEVVLMRTANKLYNEAVTVDNSELNISIEKYLPNAIEELKISGSGDPYLSVIVGGEDGRHDVYLKEGDTEFVHNFGISFGDTTNQNIVQIIRIDEGLFIRTPGGTDVESIDEGLDTYAVDGFVPLSLMNVHRSENI